MTGDGTTAKAAGFDLVAPGTAAALPTLTVVYHGDPRQIGQRTVLGEGSLVLGRNVDRFQEGTLDDPRISRKHLALERRDDRVTACDLESYNGSFLNGERLSKGSLETGDVLTLGGVMLLFHWAERAVGATNREGVVAESASMARVLTQVTLVAHRKVTVLVQGATGVGKEVVARELHRQSGRAGAFVAVNCGAISDGVLHSELFGHSRGAFSGAEQDRLGLVEEARGGTLFLDEVGDASPAMQASLLRLLEQREYRRVGDNKVHTTDARFVAATHVPLDEQVARGAFREDLFSRLSRWTIELLPLGERPEDIVPLARFFARRLVGADAALSPELTLALLRYPWPTNVRELAAVVEQAVIESGHRETVPLTETVATRLARRSPTPSRTGQARAEPPPEAPSRPSVPRPSREELAEHLAAAGGNMRQLARALGVNRSTLYRWARELDVDIQALRDRLE
jgi:DNA-binding NtrC family response regulator